MRILVTGGAGFIGSHIAETALAAGHEVAVVDDLSTGRRENVPQKAAFHQQDICDADALQKLFAAFKPDVVSHQAAQASVAISVREPARDARINILGTINLLEAAQAVGVKRFIFASTGGAIYGEVPEGTAADEDTLPQPVSPYACAKYGAEQYLRFFRQHHGLSCTALRYANVYGPRQDPHGEAGVVAIFSQRFLAGQGVKLFARRDAGDDGCVRDYVFVADVVRANLAVAAGDIDVPVLNVGTGIGTTTKQVAEALEHNLDVQADIAPADPRPGDVERSVLDVGRFKQLLGDPTPLAEGMAQTARWFAEQAKKG